ncbi:MAG: 2-hydroxyacyl-CoA dehydratase, partial [Deltaproteobacteria bacterium]|nr:2-hydroxyacyl-CoA dehydratase [Deltaproteobacteria bacterium]
GGNEEISLDRANEYLYRDSTCSFIRTVLELELRGEYDFLDCIASCSPCEGVIRLTEVGSHYHNIPILPMLDVPRKLNERASNWYRVELIEFKQHLERFFDVEIPNEAIANSIALYNKTRASLRKLHELRKQDNPPISGAEMTEVVNASVRMPREEFNFLLDRLLEEIETSKRALPGKIRLMISGALVNATPFIKALEDLGIMIIADDTCTGSRYWWELVDVDAYPDLMTALSWRYMGTQCPCPRRNPPTTRSQWILDTAKDFNVDGAIALTMRNCAPYIHDLPLWKTKLEDQGVPVLDLDIEYGCALSGQIRTRVEAFLEMLSMEMEVA